MAEQMKLIDADALIKAIEGACLTIDSTTNVLYIINESPDASAPLNVLIQELASGLEKSHDALNKMHEIHMAEVQGHTRTADRLEAEVQEFRLLRKALLAKVKGWQLFENPEEFKQ